MNSKKIGVGIIGLSASGGWAATSHVPALQSLSDNYAIVGLSASTQASAKAAAKKYGIPFSTNDPAELAARTGVDLVVITVKVPMHKQLVEAAILAGKMVYCEWPLGNGLSEAEYLADLARKRDIKSFVGLQARSAPVIHYLRDLVKEGYVGRVLSTSVIATGGSPWNGTATAATAYATDKSTGASMLAIPFGHAIDAICWTLGDFARVTASLATRQAAVHLSDTGQLHYATTADQVAVTGELQDGTIISAHFRGHPTRGSTNFLWEINGSEGDLIVTGHSGHLQFGMVSLQGGRGDDPALSELTVPAHYIHSTTDANTLVHNVAEAYANLLKDIKEGTRNLPNFDDAVATHRLLDRIENAAC